MRTTRALRGVLAALAVLHAGPAAATTLAFSDASSDSTPAALLRASMRYALADPFTLELSVTNQTSAEAPFDVSLVFFTASERLAYIELLGAESSTDGENTAAWEVGYYGYDRLTPMFGVFDYSLRTEPGAPADHRIAPGETQHFTLGVRCGTYAGCWEGDLLAHASDVSEVGRREAYAALHFTYGPLGDAAFGAVTGLPVPEPSGAWLVGLALLGLLAPAAPAPRKR